MNMSFISIQQKSTDPNFPMNGKLTHIGNVHSVSFADGVLFVKYEDNEYQINEVQFKVETISYFFVS